MTGYGRVHCGTCSHLWNIGQSGSFEGYICGFRWWSIKSNGDTSNQWAIGWGGVGADTNMGVATELKLKVGSEMGTMAATEKSRVTVGLEVEMAGVTEKLEATAGLESGVDMEVQTDSEWTGDLSRAVGVVVGAEVCMESAIVTAGGDAGVDTRSMAAGTCAGGDSDPAAEVQVETIVG